MPKIVTSKPTTIDWDKILKQLEDKYPAGIPRTQIGEATGHVLHPRTMSNRDSQGTGIKGRYRIGKNTIYPPKGVVDLLKTQAQKIDA